AFTAASIACEERRTVHDDSYAAPAFVGVLHTSKHVLEEEQLAVTDARCASAKATGVTTICFGFYSNLVHFPFFAKGGIGEQIIEMFVRLLVLCKGAAELDVFCITTITSTAM